MTKLNLRLFRFFSCLLLLFSFLVFFNQEKAYSQLEEPPVRAVDEPISPYGQGFRNRLGVSFLLNNFGFGINGIYARAIAPFTEITFTAAITTISDVSSQEFVNYFTGRKVVPNKFKRALGFPLMIGIERRLFPQAIADNFRFFISADFGPSFAFTYPYFNDENNSGYRDRVILINNRGQIVRSQFIEDTNNFFQGWGEGDWHVGFAGDLSVGVDLGTDFENQVTFEIGYFFYYFPDGLQLMEPFRNTGFRKVRELTNGFEVFVTEGREPFYEEQSYFGTPQIKFTYSWWL